MAEVSNTQTAQSAATSRPKRGRHLAVAVGIVLVLAAFALGANRLTSMPEYCGSCHEIAPTANGWLTSAHAKEAKCMDCHADAGALGELVAHLGAVREVYVHFSEAPEAGDIRGIVPAKRCLVCHAGDWAERPKNHPTQAAPCGVCHRDTAHTNGKPLFTSDLGAEEGEYSCIDCHTDRERLKADLKADPLRAKAKAASKGEG